ncbi:MAG: ATP-dependent RecD-like DNA helicase [Proteobacteria bacterium]|nr:ATP-dependent RecD-like DNA helicase [Pseudomonadota bacterium]
MTTQLHGQIERLSFESLETGFTIAQVKCDDMAGLVTVVGTLMSPPVGTRLVMTGEWQTHARFGRQFKVVEFRAYAPSSIGGIKKYLGSGLIKGIGGKMADKIVSHFGKETLTVIEKETHRLAEVGGIGKKRIAMIKKAWDDQHEIRDVMIFLQSHGVGTGFATRIFKRYGGDTIRVVQENPYVLATEITGIGFKTSDTIAASMGFSPTSPFRVMAGILYSLRTSSEDGHVYYPYTALLGQCSELLGVDKESVDPGLRQLIAEKKIIVDSHSIHPDHGPSLYLPPLFHSERGVALRLLNLIQNSQPRLIPEAQSELAWVEQRLSISLAPRQKEAVKTAMESKAMVITGGPGTGKTTIINAILKIFSRQNKKILLCAPTGRAAKRMGETTGRTAKTIHRLLEFSYKEGGFQRNERHPLSCDVLVVDETSMIDILLMYQLLKAVPFESTLILVGDVNQLPSVGAGNVLSDIISSATVPVVTLNEIFRQASMSKIIVNAHRINQGKLPYTGEASAGDDYYFIEQEEPEKVVEIIIELLSHRIPRRFNHDPVDDIQVLTPMHKGTLGSENLNKCLQEALNKNGFTLERGGRIFRVNDKVMQLRNNYDKDVFNGDIGKITKIDPENQNVRVAYEGKEVAYDYMDLDEIQLAYAISVHKSQGSEYPAVVMPVSTQHYILLQRNLIYTGVTRGRDLVVLVGTKKALAMAIGNDKTRERYTHLAMRLSERA